MLGVLFLGRQKINIFRKAAKYVIIVLNVENIGSEAYENTSTERLLSDL